MKTWNEIPNTNGAYSINYYTQQVRSNKRLVVYSDGRISPIKETIMKSRVMPNGYLMVNLSFNQIKIPKAIHRLMAEAFIPNPNNLPSVLHRNDIKSDNRAKNLFWGTQHDNMQDMMQKGRWVAGNTKLRPKQIIEIRELIKKGISAKNISIDFNVNISTIHRIKSNKAHTHILV